MIRLYPNKERIKKITDTAKKAATFLNPLGPLNPLSPTSKIQQKTGELAKEVVQGTARSGASIGLTLGKTNELPATSDSLPDKVQRAVFGSDPIQSLPKRVVDAKIRLRDFEDKHSSAKKYLGGEPLQAPLAAVGVLGMTAMDFTGGGKKKAATKVADETFDAARYVSEQVSKRKAVKLAGSGGAWSKASGFLKTAKTKLVDFAAPIEDILTDVKRSGKVLKPSEDITNQIDRVLRAPTIAGQFAKDGGLEDVIRAVPDLDALDQYLIAKHAKTISATGRKTGRDALKDESLVQNLAKDYEPFAVRVRDYSQKLLDYAVDSGLVSKQTAEKLKEAYPDYVPLNRVFSEDEVMDPFIGSKGVASLSKQSVVQKLAGSEREIESPLESLLAKTNDAFKQGEKNKAARILASYKDLPGNPFQLRELKETDHATHKISFLDDGVKRTFETTREIAEAAKALNVQQLNILGKVLAFPVRVAKLGITGLNLPFVASNVARDQVTGFIMSDKALKTSIANPVNFVRSLFEAVKHGELYDEVVREAAGGTSFDIARDQAPLTIARVRASRSVASRALYTVRHPSELLRAAENIIGRSEELTRIQQYRGTKLALIKEGMSEAEAKIAAAKAARENTVNFYRRGEWGTVLNSAFLYLNAGIQGSRTLVRNLRNKPLQTSAKIATAVLFPQAVATAWNLSDEKRREAYDDIAEFEKENNLIIVPPNPTKDERGRWNVIKIPVAQGVNNLTIFPRRAIEQAFGKDRIKAREIADAIIGTVSPISPDKGSILSTLTPQAIKPTLEVSTNKNFFTGRDIVPLGKQSLPSANQVQPYTSGSARKLAGVVGVSPIKAETFIKESAGGVGSQLLNASDRLLAKTGVIPKEQIGGEGVIAGTTRRFSKAYGGETDRQASTALAEANRQAAGKRADIKDKVQPIYEQVQNLAEEGKTAEAKALVNALSDAEYTAYKSLKASDTRRLTSETERKVFPVYQQVQSLIETGNEPEARRIVNELSDADYKVYQRLKTRYQ